MIVSKIFSTQCPISLNEYKDANTAEAIVFNKRVYNKVSLVAWYERELKSGKFIFQDIITKKVLPPINRSQVTFFEQFIKSSSLKDSLCTMFLFYGLCYLTLPLLYEGGYDKEARLTMFKLKFLAVLAVILFVLNKLYFFLNPKEQADHVKVVEWVEEQSELYDPARHKTADEILDMNVVGSVGKQPMSF